MPNPIFDTLSNKNAQPNMAQQFQQFMNQMRGQDPKKILNDLVSSGKISQNQLDIAQKQAQQLRGMFDGMRGMFGL